MAALDRFHCNSKIYEISQLNVARRHRRAGYRASCLVSAPTFLSRSKAQVNHLVAQSTLLKMATTV